MGAFEKVKSGFPDMDGLLDHIRTGDNVVWRVRSIEEFRYFAKPFARQAVKEGRNLIYMRFASHEPILEPEPGIKICEFDPDKGFEAFTVDIYNCITREGREAFYVFDSLSSLQSVWYTDLMMGNFSALPVPIFLSWIQWPIFHCCGESTPFIPFPGSVILRSFFWMSIRERSFTCIL